jgi:cell division protein FtsB
MSKLIIPGFMIMLLSLQHRMWIGDGGLMTIHQYRQQISELSNKAENIEAENQEMSLQINQLRSSIGAVESLARYDLGMIVKDEQFFLFDKQ